MRSYETMSEKSKHVTGLSETVANEIVVLNSVTNRVGIVVM